MTDLVVEKLMGFIFDDDQLVTYKWLSKKLGIHVNVSKQILWEFWRIHKEKVDMTVTFVIMGQLIDGSERIEVVEESNLSSAKEKFNKINCEHIYSLQKTLSNLQMLALVGQIDTRFTAIKCKESFLKLDEEPLVSQQSIKLQAGKQTSLEEKKTSFAQTTEEKHNSKWSEQTVSQTEDSTLKDENKEKVKKTALSKEKKKRVVEKTSKKPVQSLKAGYQNMFGKVTNLNSKCSLTKTEEIERKENVTENCIGSSDVKDSVFIECDVQMDEKTESLSEEDGAKCKFNNKRKVRSVKRNYKKTHGVIKKRKRILSDSSSAEEDSVLSAFEEETKKDTKSSENVEGLEKSSSPEINNKDCKRTIRKTEDVRFIDQDGFLVTKKVTVTAEITEDLIEERPPSASHKETNVNKKQTKQSSLMSFFNQKNNT